MQLVLEENYWEFIGLGQCVCLKLHECVRKIVTNNEIWSYTIFRQTQSISNFPLIVMFIFFSWCWGKIFLCGPRLDEAQLKVQLKQCVAPSFELVLGTQLRSESQGRKGGVPRLSFSGTSETSVQEDREGMFMTSHDPPIASNKHTESGGLFHWSRCFSRFRQTCWGWSLQHGVPHCVVRFAIWRKPCQRQLRSDHLRTIFTTFYHQWVVGTGEPMTLVACRNPTRPWSA